MDSARVMIGGRSIDPPSGWGSHRRGGEDIEVARVNVTVFDGTTAVESFNIDLSGEIVLQR